MDNSSEEIIIYSTADGKANISLLAKDGSVWLNQNQLAELFATSKANISTHISNVFEDKELQENSVVKFYLTTAADGKDYNVAYGRKTKNNLSHPYSRKRALHVCRKANTSHCKAILHDG